MQTSAPPGMPGGTRGDGSKSPAAPPEDPFASPFKDKPFD
jgi:hypothetical protein